MQWGFYTKVIVVFGSLNIDIMMPLERFPKSGETVLCVTDYLSSPGGKGANQAVAVARVGAKVAMVGKVGDDSFGRRCVSNLKHQSILTSGIGISDRPTGCATIAVDAHGANFCIVASSANLEVTSDQVPDEIMTAKNIVLAQMEVPMKETFSVLSRARARGVVTILNAAPAGILPLEELKNIDYLIVNEIEAVQIAQNLGITGNDPRLLAGVIAQKGDLTCIITLEVKGSVAARGSDLYAIAPLPVEAVDTTGAGDVFCGIFAACLQMDRDWLRALHCSSVGAALSCQGMGAQGGVLSMEDIEKNLDKIPPPEKIG